MVNKYLNVVEYTPVTRLTLMMIVQRLTMASSDSETEIITSFKEVNKACSWCKEYTKLKSGKSYCNECASKMHKECSRCRLPYPEVKYFTIDPNRCNACQLKLEKERAKRKNKAQQPATTSTTISKQKNFETEMESPCKKFKLHVVLSEV